MSSWTKELDEASELATKSGHWHVLLFYLLCALAGIPTSFLVFSQVFTNAIPEHWCAPPPELEVIGLPEETLRALVVPRTADNTSFESCFLYDIDPRALYAALPEYVDERSEIYREGGSIRLVNIRQLITVSDDGEKREQLSKLEEALRVVRGKEPVLCTHGWKFSKDQYDRTLVTDFSLVCGKDWWPRTSNTLFWVGSIFGNLFFGWMSDRYGRRPTILLMIFLEVPLAIGVSFVRSYTAYTALRVLCGLFFPALYQLPFILALEIMPPKKRTYTGIVVGMLFAGGMCLLALLAFSIRDWFALSLATSLPFLFLYSYFWLIPESPRWLVGRGRVGEAEKVLRDIARKNGIELPYGYLLELHKKVKEEEAELEASILSNGHISILPELRNKQDLELAYTDRHISNMLTFRSDLSKIEETDVESNKSGDIERIIALEVAEIVNRKSRMKERVDDKNNVLEEDEYSEESQFNCQKATQTDPCKTPVQSLRRKSIQIVSKMFLKGDGDFEGRKMDDENSEGDCKVSPLDVLRYPNIRKKFLILTFDWVALGVVYNSLSYNTPNLGVDDYLAFFIGGAVELPSYILAWKFMDRFGRRWVLCVFMCVGGLACLSCVLVPDSLPWVRVSFAMLGRLFAAASFAVFYVVLGELLPTVLRARAMAAASLVAGLALLACPHIVHLAVYSKMLPLLIMGILSIAGGIAALFLPETLNEPLPQTLSDGETFGRDFKIFSCVKRTTN